MLAVITLVLFIWGVNYLKGRDIFQKQLEFYVVYDKVTGLIESNPVSLNGLPIGQVKRISFHPDGSGRILVECLVGNAIALPDNSIAHLVSPGLIGSREIEIELGNSGHFISSGDTLEGIFQASLQDEVATQLLPIKAQAESLLAQMDTVLTIFSQVFTPATRESLSEGISDFSNTLDNLENASLVMDTTLVAQAGRISEILGNAASISRNIQENNDAIERIIHNFSTLSDTLVSLELVSTIEQAKGSLGEFALAMDKINRGEGTFGLLLNDQALYLNLERSSRQLDLLLEDIKENPGKYFSVSVFGR